MSAPKQIFRATDFGTASEAARDSLRSQLMCGQHRFRVAMAGLFLIGCHTHSTYAPPALPPPPLGPVYVPESAETETREVEIGADDTYRDNDPSALDDFRGALDAHGAWVDDNEYGTVWLPAPEEVGPAFVPYATAGHWVYDDDDYVWVSDYPWGWVPFHYGRWVLIGGRGWAWIPGRVYAGAWVSWRIGASVEFGYVGWAPMPPLWIWRNRIAVGMVVAPPAHYIFCPRHEIFAPRVSERIIRGPSVVAIERRTRVYVAPPAYGTGGRVVARPVPAGPSPSALRIDPSRVARLTPRDQGIYTARRYSVPSTARPLGARAPTPQVTPPRPPQPSGSRLPLGAAAPQPPSPTQRSRPQRVPATPLPHAAPPVRTPAPQALPRAPSRIPGPVPPQRAPQVAPSPVSPSPAPPPAAKPRAPSPQQVPQRVPSPQRARPAPRVRR